MRKEKRRRKIASKVTDEKPQNDPNAASPDKLVGPPKRAMSNVSGTEDQSTEPQASIETSAPIN